jgi:hypothetical protein
MQHQVFRTSQSLAALFCAVPFLAVHVSHQAFAGDESAVAALEAQCEAQRNAVRGANGVMVPRMFSELPVCVAAFKARKALADDAR